MRWLVIGAGVSGREAALLLRTRHHKCVVYDRKAPDPKVTELLGASEIPVICGSHKQVDLTAIDRIVVSPGIPESHPLLIAAASRSISIHSEIDLALDGYDGRIIGVTGTNGKSTTVSLIHHILEAAGIESSLCGNIGIPVSRLARLQELKENLVVELSSYQLEQSSALRLDFAGFTSFSQDHLARHKTLKNYMAAKWKIVSCLKADHLFCIEEDALEAARSLGFSADGKKSVIVTDQLIDKLQLRLENTPFVGRHDLVNACIAAYAAKEIGDVPFHESLTHLKTFSPLPHRLEVVGSIGGRRLINDSKSTNVESTLTALKSMNRPVVLLLGGQGKGETYKPILAAKSKVERILSFGSESESIRGELSSEIDTTTYATLGALCHDLEIILASSKGDVLLSPACASFDEFSNFEERGDFFSQSCKDTILRVR